MQNETIHNNPFGSKQYESASVPQAMNEGTSGCENLAGRGKNMKECEPCVSRNCLAHLGASHRKTDSQIPEASSQAKAVDLAQLQDKGVQSPAHAVLDLHWTQIIAFAQKLNGLRRKQALWIFVVCSVCLVVCLLFCGSFQEMAVSNLVALSWEFAKQRVLYALDQNTLFASVHYGLWLTIVVLLFSNY